MKKNQTKSTDEIVSKILSMFALGMSYNDMCQHARDMYGLDVSQTTISSITERLIPEMKEWQ